MFKEFLEKKQSSSRGLSSFNQPSPSRKSLSTRKSSSVRRPSSVKKPTSVNVGQLPTNEIEDKLGKLFGKLVKKKRNEKDITYGEISTAKFYINKLPEEERVEIQRTLDNILKGNEVATYVVMNPRGLRPPRPPRPTGEKPPFKPLQRRELTPSYAKQLRNPSYASIPSRNPTYDVPNSLGSP